MGKELNNMPNDDLEKIRARRNPPEYEPGFAPDDGVENFDFEQFNNINMDGLNNENDIFGNPFSSDPSNNTLNGDPFNPFGGGNSVFGSPFEQPFGEPLQKRPDNFDIIMDKLMISGGAFARVFQDTVKSFKNRTAQEIGIYGKNLMFAGLSTMIGSLILGFLGFIGDIGVLSFYGLPTTLFLSGVLVLGVGIIALTLPAYLISKGYIQNDNRSFKTVIEDVDLSSGFQMDSSDDMDISTSWENDTSDYDFPDDDFLGDESIEDDFEDESIENELDYNLDDLFNNTQSVDLNSAVAQIPENAPIISRSYLVDTFKNFLPKNTQGFADRRTIKEGTKEFENLEGIIIKALMAVTKTDIDTFDVETHYMIDAIETLFTYEIRFTRYKGQKNLDEIANEVVAYYIGYTNSKNVSAQVSIIADYYKIVIFKGTQTVVTLGDVLQLPESVKFFKNEKNKLPFCVGIQPDGSPMLRDAKIFDTMLIAGKPRSGKSWFALNILVNLMAFNTPEDVQFIIVDPKNSALMNTIALMPHVCGFHKNDYILRLLDDIISNEGQRREKLLLEHKCDDIWSLREKTGIKLPLLYLFIDEYMTVVNDLDKDEQKELQSKLNVLISQLPSKGIRLIFVPHRSQGVVDKTTRTMISFSCAIKATAEVVKETLDVPKFDMVLTNPGDVAVMMVGENKPYYVKGNAVAVDDDLNKDLIVAMAKAFYKMGVDIPDMSTMRLAANRDEEKVKSELYEDYKPTYLKFKK